MSVTPENLLAYSEQISCSEEAGRRDAIGRSYYAAYHKADSWHIALPSPGHPPANAGSHERLIGSLTAPTVSGALSLQSRSIGYMLRLTKQARKRADYDLQLEILQIEVDQAIANARKIVEKAG